MTRREQQILRWIEENPMISQQELAERAGITRSSVAVHIANLMKKGLIAGRGYILAAETYAAVVGAVNVDVGGIAGEDLVYADSNPGRVRKSLGGVGRNIAHNMALLGLDTRLITAFGDDSNAREIAASCAALGIDVSQSLRIAGAATSSYLFIADQNGEMALAVSDMDIYRHMTPEALVSRLPTLNNSKAVVLDANLPEDTIRWLCRNVETPVFADPVSTVKAEKLRQVLGALHTLKPNKLEAEILSGVEITDERSLHSAADRLLEAGVEQLFISLGPRGVLAADRQRRYLLPSRAERIVNTTGCGDAFTAGLVWAFFQGLDLRESAEAGLAAASVAMEAAGTINPELNRKILVRRMENRA